MQPAPGAPPWLGMMAPMAMPVQRQCRNRYHEANPQAGKMEYCSCETGAIGRCSVDHRPVCGFHSDLRDGKRLCDECVQRYDVEQARAAVEARAAELFERMSPVVAACAALDGVGDAFDRAFALFVMARTAHLYLGTAIPTQPAMRQSPGDPAIDRARAALDEVLANAARHLLDGVRGDWRFSPARPEDWTFDGRALIVGLIARHRLDLTTARQLAFATYIPSGFRGARYRTTGSVRGWLIRSGSHGTSGSYGSSGSPDIYVLEDGTVASVGHTSTNVDEATRRTAHLGDVQSLFKYGFANIDSLSAPVRAVLDPALGVSDIRPRP
jgi:hypothetical protein